MKLKQNVLFGIAIFFLAARGWAATGLASVEGTVDESDISGHLKFEDTPKGLKITGLIENIPSGDHGFHIHEFGDCTEEGKNAGGHFNPDQKPHGQVLKEGVAHVHAGDMGNLIADEKGMAPVDVLIPGVSLTGKYAVAGRAVIVHEKKDDFGQPTGNAGGRIACGPIVLTGK